MSMRDAVKIETAIPGIISAVNHADNVMRSCNPMNAFIPVFHHGMRDVKGGCKK